MADAFRTLAYAGADVEGELPGRVRSLTEYITCLQSRVDIFQISRNRLIAKIEAGSMLLALGIGIFLSSGVIDTQVIQPDFMEKIFEDYTATAGGTIDRPNATPPEETPQADEPQSHTERKTLNQQNASRQGSTGGKGSAGSPRERVLREGVFAELSKNVKGRDALAGDPLSIAGFMKDIDQMIVGQGSLAQGGHTRSGRADAVSMGFAEGMFSGGTGDGGGGVEDLVNRLAQSTPLNFGGEIGRRGSLRLPEITTASTGALIHGQGRSRMSISQVIMMNINSLRHAYNARLRVNPDLKGKVQVRFAIDEFGTVVHCELVESTIGDPELEKVVIEKIRRFKFDKIDKPGDITEVVYPFVFNS